MTKEQITEETLKHFSEELSEEIKKYAIDVVLLHSRYIFLESKGRKQFGYCTHCKETFSTGSIRVTHGSVESAWTHNWKLKHNAVVDCPNCKSKCTAKHAGKGRNNLRDTAYFVFYEKSVKDSNVITARGIYVERDYFGDYKETETYYNTKFYYAFEMGKAIMLKSNYYSEIEKTSSIYTGYKNYAWNRSIILNCCIPSIKKAVKGTPFEYSPYKKFLSKSSNNLRLYVDDMVDYFSMCCKYPFIEILDKIGMSGLVEDKYHNRNFENAVNWRGKKLINILRLTKQNYHELKSLIKQGLKVDSVMLKVFQIVKKENAKFKIDELMEIASVMKSSGLQNINFVLAYTSLKKTFNYINRQYKTNPNKFYGLSDTLKQWVDYLKKCKELNLDLTKEINFIPKNLLEAHQKVVNKIKAVGDRKIDKLIKKRLRELNKFNFVYNGLFIRPARSTEELINEGEVLDHCVGDYSEDYAKGETNILFIRKVDEPDTPFYTMELLQQWDSNEYEIEQCRGYDNKIPEEYGHSFVREFINAFKIEKLGKAIEKIGA